MNRRLLWLFALVLAAQGALAQETETETETEAESDLAEPVIELESRVTGNREQPQVFHVVPWQTPESPVPDYNPLQRQLRSVFGHIERDELRRRLRQEADLPSPED